MANPPAAYRELARFVALELFTLMLQRKGWFLFSYPANLEGKNYEHEDPYTFVICHIRGGYGSSAYDSRAWIGLDNDKSPLRIFVGGTEISSTISQEELHAAISAAFDKILAAPKQVSCYEGFERDYP